ncbi:MAG: hypothetical protein ACI8Z9_002533 [Paraglaciecola sp.]|jgi:hypothetical protein
MIKYGSSFGGRMMPGLFYAGEDEQSTLASIGKKNVMLDKI